MLLYVEKYKNKAVESNNMRHLLLDIWQPDCPIVYLSEKMQDLKIYIIMPHVLPIETRVLFTVRGGDLQKVVEILRKNEYVKYAKTLRKDKSEEDIEVVCKTTHAMQNFLYSHVLFQRSLYASNGLERWFIIVKSKKDEDEILSRLKERNEVKIVEKGRIKEENFRTMIQFMAHPLSYLQIPSILTSLSLSKTQEALLKEILRERYYDYPRRTNLTKLAKSIGVSKVTVVKNLRKLEGIGIEMLFSLLKIKKENQFGEI